MDLGTALFIAIWGALFLWIGIDIARQQAVFDAARHRKGVIMSRPERAGSAMYMRGYRDGLGGGA